MTCNIFELQLKKRVAGVLERQTGSPSCSGLESTGKRVPVLQPVATRHTCK